MYKLEKFGSFFVGGRKIIITDQKPYTVKRSKTSQAISIDQNGEFIIESSYVQFFIPEQSNSHQIIFVHGGGNTGAVWESRLNDSEGWLHYFLNKQYSCYLIDTVERGRAGWCHHPNVWEGPPERKSMHQLWDIVRIGTIDNYDKKIPFPSSQFPYEHLKKISQLDVPRWNCNQSSSRTSLVDLLNRTSNSSILFSHSQSSEFVIEASADQSSDISAVILLEPASFPEKMELTKLQNIKFLFIYGDNIVEHWFWGPVSIKAKLFYNKLKKHGIDATWYDLPTMGVVGNSHYPMFDRNSAEVLSLIDEWMKSLNL